MKPSPRVCEQRLGLPVAGTILGAVIGTIAIRLSLRSMLNSRRGTLIGIGADVAVWFVLFLPITALLVQPSVNNIVILSAIGIKAYGIFRRHKSVH
jgi:hypothetical protein